MKLRLKREIQFYKIDNGLFHVYVPDTMRHFKIGEREIGWLHLLNGENSRDDLAQVIPQEFLDKFLQQVVLMQLVDSTQKNKNINILKLRFRLLNPNKFLSKTPRFNEFYKRILNWSSLVSIIMNIVWLSINWQKLSTAMTYVQFNSTIVFFYFGAILLMGFVHELSHAIVAKSFGVNVPCIGFMLFYLHPAFFADVSGLNLISDKKQRINILLAGLMSNSLLMSLSIPLTYFFSGTTINVYANYFILLNLLIMLINLIPFVEYDGYYIFLNLINDPTFKFKAQRSIFRIRNAKIEHIIFGFFSNLFIASLLFSAILIIRNYIAKFVNSEYLNYIFLILMPLMYVVFMVMQNRKRGTS